MRIHKIGDPHLGRKFRNGVPLHRRGDREAMVNAQFERELDMPCDLNICVGDLFNERVVPPETILFAANAYRRAAAKHMSTIFVILMGNHDGSRDADQRSAFDIFQQLVADVPNDNIIVVRGVPWYHDGLYFFPWHPFKTAAQMVEEVIPVQKSKDWVPIAVGHWDVKSFGDDSNLVPAKELLALGCKSAITGHYHVAGRYNIDGLDVEVTGSMQPYAHGEEADDELYVTVAREDLPDDLSVFKDKCLRVLLRPGEALPPEAIDCLQLTVKRVGDGDDTEAEVVELDPFDLEKMFGDAMTAEGLAPEFTAEIWAKFKDMKHD